MEWKYFLFFICLKNAVAKRTITNIRELCQDNVDVEELAGEVEIALNDFVDNFFKLFEQNDSKPDQNYCKKAAPLQRYLEDFAQGIAPCIATDDGGYDYSITRTGVVLVLNYMCSKVGDEYKVFTNFSQQCFKDNIIKCISKMQNVKNIPVTKAALSLSVNDPCGNFNQLSSCVATSVDECSKDNSDKPSKTCCKYYGSCEKT